jgi:preprotein translocase subunit SecE
VAKAVKSKDNSGKGARGSADKADKGKARGKAPAKQSRAARARAQSRTSAKGAKGEKRGIAKFMRDVRVEMGKVTWPTRQDLIQSTVVVLVAVAIAAALTALYDLAFSQFVDQVLKLIS